MSIRYLDLSGAVNFWTNIKNYILSKIPTKTSELTNDSGFLTQHQSLSNYVTLNSEQTITGKKLFTNATTKVNSVNTFNGSTQFIDLSTTVPRGSFPAEDHRVGRVYIGDNTSYNGAWFIIDPTITTNKAYYRMVTTNPDNTDSTRFSIMWDSTETGARCRKNISTGDLLPYANNTYNLGSNNQKWDIGYIHNLIGSNKEDLTEDANNYYSTTSGSHMTFYTTSNGGTKLSNVPSAVNTHLESRTIRYLSSSDWIIEQICHNSFGLYYRKGTNGTWEDWKTFAFTNSNITGTAANVTGTVAIANGGTGATSRLSAIKNLTNESVGTPTHFLGLTTNYAKCGYTSIAQAKTVLGITGDISSHSDSEYVHKTGDESITGTKTFGNGTLIVDNGTGNNVHGEIKLNGTRPVYINADNSEDGLFANTACGMSIILNDSSKSIHIGGYTTNSSGRKLIKTADKAPYLTLGTQEVGTQILVPENDTADSTFSITSTLKYASGASAKSFTVKFRQSDDGSSGVFPVANNKTDLGLSSNRWKNVYATNYYYGSDAVEFSTKFVTTDTNQTISGGKTFTSSPLIYNSDATGSVPQITFKNSKTTKGSTTETGAQLIYFTDKNDAPLSMIESRVVSNGCTTLSTVAYNFNDSQNVSSSVQLIKNPTTAYYAPGADNDISLGRASARWLGVYATNYYYGSDNTEFSTKFVTSDTTQTISGAKTFSSTITGSISGNASTATEFSANKSVTLTGDVTGTASSKAGWSVNTTLSNSGVTAGTYGPSEDVTGNNNATISVPEITVDSKGRVTAITNRTYTSVNTDNDKRVHQYYKTDDNVYRLLWCYDAGNTSTSTLASKYTAMNNAFYVNPSTGALYATKLYSGGTEVLTSHQSLDNYVTLDSNQTITAIKTITGGNQGKMIFKNPNFTVGTTPESTTTVARIYFGGGASYDGSTGVITNDISSNGYSQLEICALNNNSSNSYRTSLILRYEQDQTRPRFIKSWGDFCPYYNDTYYLGRSDSVWKECYCNAYYLGTTAFGDIVTHNASEFLTSHQSLSSCVKNVVTNNQTIKSTGITRGTAPSSAQTFGIAFSDNNNKYIGNIYGQYATDKSTYVGLYAYKGTTTSNGDNAYIRVGYDASGNVYTSAPTPATADNSTQIATTAFVKAQGYLTSHQSLANYVTTNTDQSISGIKSHSKHISILGDYVGNESSTNGRSCLYLKANRDTDGKSGLYVTKYRQNRAQGSMGNSDTVFLSHDILENETRTNAGFVESYSNWANDVPGGMSIYSTIATSNLGTSAKPWTNTYAVNFYENGTALSDKYLTVSAISGGASTEAGNITPVKGTIISGFAESEAVTYSTEFGGVLVAPSRLYYAICVYNTSNSTMSYYMGPSVGGTGTWKLMGGGVSNPGSSTKLLFGLWIKIV